MSSPKHEIYSLIENLCGTGHAACSCKWRGPIREFPRGISEEHAESVVLSLVKVDGLQHAVEVATSVLPNEYKPVFKD